MGAKAASDSEPFSVREVRLVHRKKNSNNANSNNKKNDYSCSKHIPTIFIHVITKVYGRGCCLYGILNVSRSASQREIRNGYLRLGQKVSAACGNDLLNLSGLSDKEKLQFEAMTMVFEILSNNDWRWEYDNLGLLEGEGMLDGDWGKKGEELITLLYNQGGKEEEGEIQSKRESDKLWHKHGYEYDRLAKAKKRKRNEKERLGIYLDSQKEVHQEEQEGRLSLSSSSMSRSILRNSKHQVRDKEKSDLQSSNFLSKADAIRVSWSDDVEELVFDQSPEEVAFKYMPEYVVPEENLQERKYKSPNVNTVKGQDTPACTLDSDVFQDLFENVESNFENRFQNSIFCLDSILIKTLDDLEALAIKILKIARMIKQK